MSKLYMPGDTVMVAGDLVPAVIVCKRLLPNKQWDGSYVVQHSDRSIGYWFPSKLSPAQEMQHAEE
jgi:hypothetical protein